MAERDDAHRGDVARGDPPPHGVGIQLSQIERIDAVHAQAAHHHRAQQGVEFTGGRQAAHRSTGGHRRGTAWFKRCRA